jgi:hypothetical protein
MTNLLIVWWIILCVFNLNMGEHHCQYTSLSMAAPENDYSMGFLFEPANLGVHYPNHSMPYLDATRAQ